MNTAEGLYHIDVPTVSLSVAAIVLFIGLPASALIGFAMGKRVRRLTQEDGGETAQNSGETTLSAILALLGLLLAFSFGNALSHAQELKTSITNEAAALGTAFLRADYLEEPGRTELKRALLAYSETRVLPEDHRISSPEAAQAFISVTLEAQAKLWPLTLDVTRDPTPPPIKAFVASAVNQALDAHLVRVQLMSHPISEVTQAMMFAAALAALFLLGNRAGLLGQKLTWRIYVFSGFLFVVMVTIMDSQRGGEGLIRMDETTLRATILDMQTALSLPLTE